MSVPIAGPSRDDPVVAAASEWLGGPYGEHGQRARPGWWTPVRVSLAVACLGGVFTGDGIIWNELYAVAVMVRATAVLWFAGLVVRDIRRRDLDPVRPYLPSRDTRTATLAATAQ